MDSHLFHAVAHRLIVAGLSLLLCTLLGFLATLYGPESVRKANPLRVMTNVFKNSEVYNTNTLLSVSDRPGDCIWTVL